MTLRNGKSTVMTRVYYNLVSCFAVAHQLFLGFLLVPGAVAICPNFSQNVSISGSNASTCICPVEQYYRNNECNVFQPYNKSGQPADAVYDFYFTPSYNTDNFRKTASSETIFFVTTIILILVWFGLVCSLRCLPLGDGNVPGGGIVFKLRYGVTRLDRRYHRKHWMDEQKVLAKRRTELGGACSAASYIFTVGTLLGLTWQEFVKEQPLVQSLVVNNGREVASFANYLFWNITIVSGMDCSQFAVTGATVNDGFSLRGLNSTGVGADFTCEDTSVGPSILLTCPRCQALSDEYTATFEFSDQQGKAALASGFQFFFRASQSNGSRSRESVSTGSFKANGTLRGPVENVLWFRGIPRVIKDAKNLKLLQATFHEYLNGSLLKSESDIVESVANSSQPVRFTLKMEILSDYIVETDRNNRTLTDILNWLAAMGGMYLLGISLFYLLQLQVEIRVRSLAYDERLMAIAKRVFHRRKLWRKLKYHVKALHLLNHWNKYKKEYDEEKKQLLDDMEEQQNALEKETVMKEKKEKEDYYSGFLRKRSSLGNDAQQQPLMDYVDDEHSKPIPEFEERNVQKPDGEGQAGVITNVDLGVPDTNSGKDQDEPVAEAAAAPLAPALPSSFASGPPPPSIEVPSQTSRNPFLPSPVAAAGHAIAHGGSKVLHPIGAVVSHVVPTWNRGDSAKEARRGGGAGDGGSEPLLRSRSANDNALGKKTIVDSPTGEQRSGSNIPGLATLDKVRHGAAHSLGAAAHLVRPRIPHVNFFSGPFPSPGKYFREVSGGGTEGSSATVPDVPLPPGKAKKRSKVYMTYGSNTHYQGTLIQEYRKPSWLVHQEYLPAVPSLDDEHKDDDEEGVNLEDLTEHVKDMYAYNVRLRQDFLAFQTMIENMVQYFRPHSDL